MNDLQRRWVEALESGTYPQVQGELRSNAGFCCLGVFCEILIQDGDPDLSWGGNCYIYRGEQLQGVLDYGLHEKLGLRTADGACDKGGAMDSLVLRNDSGSSFQDIAAFIRKNEDLVFKET